MLKKVDSYILTEFWLPFAGGGGIITGVWLGIDKFKEVFKLLARSGASFSTGIVILGLEIPHILALTIPISILLAAFLSFQKLSGQSEIIAMRAAGLSFTRMMKPVLIFGLLGTLMSFTLSEFVVPITTPFAKKVYTLALYKNPISSNSVEGFSYFEKDADNRIQRIFYVKEIVDNSLKKVVILDFSKNDLSMIHVARRAAWEPLEGGWVLEDGSSSYIKENEPGKNKAQLLSAEPSSETMHIVSNFKRTLIPSSLNPNEILKKMTKLQELNFIGLYQYIKLHESDKLYTSTLDDIKTKFHGKFSYPVSCLLLAITGACLGITGRRKVVNFGYIALGLVVFVFYMSQTIFDSFGNSGKIDPMLSVWIPNFILLAIALISFSYRANR